jgi:hypothetical protein
MRLKDNKLSKEKEKKKELQILIKRNERIRTDKKSLNVTSLLVEKKKKTEQK